MQIWKVLNGTHSAVRQPGWRKAGLGVWGLLCEEEATYQLDSNRHCGKSLGIKRRTRSADKKRGQEERTVKTGRWADGQMGKEVVRLTRPPRILDCQCQWPTLEKSGWANLPTRRSINQGNQGGEAEGQASSVVAWA